MKYLLFILGLLVGQLVVAQEYSITIIDNKNQVIPFATLSNKTTKTNKVADAQGNIVYNSSESDTLTIRALGFTSRTIATSDINQIDTIVLNENNYFLNEIAITASKINPFGFSPHSLAASEMYLSERDLGKIPSKDIHQILYQVPGVQIQQEDGFGLRPNIGMRGTGTERSSKITLMEDGVLIAPAPYSASAAYYFPSMDHISSVEIVKGSSQILFGPQTNGGALNLISDPIQNQFTLNIRSSLGSFLTRKFQTSISDSKENFAYLIKGTYFGSNGFKKLNDLNTGFNRGDYLVKLRFNTKENSPIKQSFLIKYSYTQEKSNETYLGITANDFEQDPLARYAASALDNIQSTHTQIMLDHIIEPFKNTTISTQIYLNKFSRNWFKLDKLSWNGDDFSSISSVFNNIDEQENNLHLLRGDALNPNNRLLLKNNNRSYNSKGIQSQLYYLKENEKWDHQLKIAYRLHADEMDRFQWTDEYTMNDKQLQLIEEGIPGTESNRIESARAFATFAQYKLSYNKWSFEPGVRFEYIQFNRKDYGKEDVNRIGKDVEIQTNKNIVVLPGFSMQYQISEKNNFFIGVHKGFSPSNYNAETLAESSWNIELGTKGVKKGIAYELIFFNNNYQNLLGSDLAAAGGIGSTELYNGGKALVWGFESLIGMNLLKSSSTKYRLPFTIAYTYTNAKFKNNFESDGPWGVVNHNDFFPYLAQHLMSSQIGLEHKKFMLNLLFKMASPRYINPNQSSFTKENSIPLFYQLDFIGNYHLNKSTSMFLKLNNLSNRIQRIAFHPAGWRSNMPFYIEGGVALRFQ